MQVLEPVFATLKVAATIFNNGQYCGQWATDTAGSSYINFHVVSHGSCFLKVAGKDDKVEQLFEGDMVIFPRDSHHCLTNDESFSLPINEGTSVDFSEGEIAGATGLVCGYFSYQHPIVNHITEQLPDVIILRNDESNSDALYVLIRTLVSEAKKASFTTNWILNKIADAIMALLFENHLSGSEGILAGMVHPKIGPVIEAVQAAPDKKWTVDALAQASHMSRTAFSELFKQVCGMTPMEFVTYWRLSTAYRWLADGEQTTLGAALAIGYENESSFSKAFKRVMGISPGAVRNAAVI